MKTVIITGVPGTGKTTLAKKLSLLLNYTYFDGGDELKKAGLYGKFDQKRHCFEVNEEDLSPFFEKVREDALSEGQLGLILDSHLAHYLSPLLTDMCIVTACSDLKQLEKRLKERGYDAAKVRENLDAEIFEICLVEAREQAHKIVLYDSANIDKALDNQFMVYVKNRLS